MRRTRFVTVALAVATLSFFMLGQGGCPTPGDGGSGGNSGITGQYIGSTRCALCHANTHAGWSDTLHAHALETLEAIGQGSNPNCIGCHVVGHGDQGGFVNRATTNDLAGVGCEACHGPAAEHARNANDETLYPGVSIASELCGRCHTGSHHPHYEDWATSRHARVDTHVAERFMAGNSVTSCGECHSGDYVYGERIQGGTVPDNALAGVPIAEMHANECAICHDPHMRTNNAVTPEDGRDYQLRFPEVAYPAPATTIAAVTNPARFNLCGQCHHSRGRTWADGSRGPHHSIQANVYYGEMPLPDEDSAKLVPGRVSVHLGAVQQCATCHLHRQDFMSEEAPAISGHTFAINELSCISSNCHNSLADALFRLNVLQTEIQERIDDIKNRLGPVSQWGYTSDGGPNAAGQAALPDEIKKARFLISYAEYDGSLGMHNPAYVREMLIEADDLLDKIGR